MGAVPIGRASAGALAPCVALDGSSHCFPRHHLEPQSGTEIGASDPRIPILSTGCPAFAAGPWQLLGTGRMKGEALGASGWGVLGDRIEQL